MPTKTAESLGLHQLNAYLLADADRDLRVDEARDVRPRDERDRLGGTLAPFLRASLRPIAIACLRLRTRPPEPERKVPRFRLRIALSTLVDAFFEYRLRVVAIGPPPQRSLGPRPSVVPPRPAAGNEAPAARAALDLLQFLLNLPRAFEVALDGRHRLHCPFHERLLAARTT
jgi:hypothetical protein